MDASSIVSCSKLGNIHAIQSAFFGRRVPGTVLCPFENNLRHKYTSNTGCGDSDSAAADTAIVQSLCINRTSCDVLASTNVFSDPCDWTYKYLKITYSCIESNPKQYSAGMLLLFSESDILTNYM